MTIASRDSRRLPALAAAAALLACSMMAAAQNGTRTPPAPPAAPQRPAPPAAPAPTTAPTEPAATPAPAVRPADLPSAKEILDKSVAAMGGTDALAKIESSSAKVTAEIPGMGEMKMDLASTRDGKFLIKQIMPNNMGEFTVASDGTNGWMESPTRPSQLLGSDQVAAMRDQITTMLGPIQPLIIRMENYPKMEVLDRVPYEGEESYKLKLTDADGNERLAFFSTATGLMRGTEVTQESPMGQLTTTLNFHEWTDKDGIKVPMKRTMDQMGMSSTMTLTEVAFNTVDPSVFQPSDAIKQMISSRNNPTAPVPPAAPAPAPAPPASTPPSNNP